MRPKITDKKKQKVKILNDRFIKIDDVCKLHYDKIEFKGNKQTSNNKYLLLISCKIDSKKYPTAYLFVSKENYKEVKKDYQKKNFGLKLN